MDGIFEDWVEIDATERDAVGQWARSYLYAPTDEYVKGFIFHYETGEYRGCVMGRSGGIGAQWVDTTETLEAAQVEVDDYADFLGYSIIGAADDEGDAGE